MIDCVMTRGHDTEVTVFGHAIFLHRISQMSASLSPERGQTAAEWQSRIAEEFKDGDPLPAPVGVALCWTQSV